jgi:Na+/proline symporter
MRTGAAFSSGADAFIALSVLRALFDQKKAPVTGEPIQQKNMVAHLLQFHWGYIAVMSIGVIVLITAVVLILYGLSQSFTEAIKANDFSKKEKRALHTIAYAGYFSRGIILFITGFFFVKAAIKNNSSHIVNTDKAFDFIGDHIGHPWFILIALGTVSYGIYMFILGLHYDVDGKRTNSART